MSNINPSIIYRIVVVGLLLYIATQLTVLNNILKTNEEETNLVISKLDYVESDINAQRVDTTK
jgi:hypothetical protein